jgi:hypothetical protein
MLMILPARRAFIAGIDGAGHEEGRIEVGRHQAAPVGVAEALDRPAVLDAGVVDEDVDRADRVASARMPASTAAESATSKARSRPPGRRRARSLRRRRAWRRRGR